MWHRNKGICGVLKRWGVVGAGHMSRSVVAFLPQDEVKFQQFPESSSLLMGLS